MNWRKLAPLAVVALGLYLVGLGVVGGLHFWLRRDEHAHYRRLVRLGEQHAPMPGPAAPSTQLWRACADAVPDGSPEQFAGYNAHVPQKDLPAMPEPGEAPWVLDESVVALRHDVLENVSMDFDRIEVARQSATSLVDAVRAELDPTNWPDHVRWGLQRRALRQGRRYLVAARYVRMTPPEVHGETFTAPTGEFLARVLEIETGAVRCEGRGELTMTSSVQAGGSGDTKAEAQADAEERLPSLVQFVFTLAVADAPVHELCAQGHFCEATGRYVAWPKDRPWTPDRRK